MPKRPNAIALFFATTEKSGKVLEPENLFYLFPDSIYSCFEEGSGKQSIPQTSSSNLIEKDIGRIHSSSVLNNKMGVSV
jgi:hypothetical protein